jgi:hypothetical protein
MQKNHYPKKYTFILNIILFFSFFNFCISSLKFNIPNNRDKCFYEEIYTNGTLLIRYDLKGIESIKKENQEKVLKNLKLFIKDPNGRNVREIYLTNRKDKFAFRADVEGYYQICARYYKSWSITELPKEVMLGIKIRTDYDYKSLETSLEKKDIDHFKEQIRILKSKVVPSISSSKQELDEEDVMAKKIISTSKLYFKLTIIQLVLIVIIAVYQIFNIKKFLTSKQII